jgi:hypothetical protein
MADAVSLPTDGSISGRPISLLSVIAAVPDRAKQLEAVHAYWRLVQAIGDYRYCHERQRRLARLKASGDEAADLRTAQAIAVAQLHEAELHTISAQQELAGKLDFPETAPLPLPADRPLTESYRTRFAELFAARRAPDRVRMLDQTLPLRQRAVESHSAAVLAADEALDVALELQASGQVRLACVLRALDAQLREQRAFIAAVCRYNDCIVDYSLAVIPAQTSAAVIVSTLIKQARPSGAIQADSSNIPVQFQQAMTVPGAGIPALAGRPEPDRLKAELQPPALIAPPATESSIPKPPQPWIQTPPAATVPATAPPLASPFLPPAMPVPPSTTPAAPPSSAPSTPAQNREDQAPALGPPQELTIPQNPPQADGAKPTPSAAVVWTAFKVVAAEEPRDNATRLAAEIFTASISSMPAGKPLPLADCIRAAAPNHRLGAITAYWQARREGAIVQLNAQEQRWLDDLKPAIAAQNPPSPTAMLNLRSARTSVDARLVDAEADCLAAEFELAFSSGLTADSGAPWPISIPFAGHFTVGHAANQSWKLRQQAAAISGHERTVYDHAVAVAESEAARTAATAGFHAGRTSIEDLLFTIDVQASQTAAFIDGVVDYNQLISQSVLSNSTPNQSAESLAESLMVRQ